MANRQDLPAAALRQNLRRDLQNLVAVNFAGVHPMRSALAGASCLLAACLLTVAALMCADAHAAPLDFAAAAKPIVTPNEP
ncbi:MAG: hypothetical protein JO269_11320 [Burkholderiaceae bacterium]|nr:hypothetical protein [Burkholderiaceae bacterium]